MLSKRKSLFHTHRFKGYGNSVPYLYNKTNDGVIDGINRMHIDLFGTCESCGEQVLVAKLHCDENGKLYKGVYDK